MHKFFKTDAVGAERDFGNPAKAGEFAKKFLGRDAVCAVAGNDVIWFLPADLGRASVAVGVALIPVSSVGTQRAAVKAKKDEATAAHNEWALNRAGENAKRVSHVKLGEGTVVAEDEKAWTVLFAGQKKPMRMVPAMLEVLA